jgi:hypothetical protein
MYTNHFPSRNTLLGLVPSFYLCSYSHKGDPIVQGADDKLGQFLDQGI